MINGHDIDHNLYGLGYHVIDNFLEQKDYQALRKLAQFMHLTGQLRQAKIGHSFNALHNAAIRGDKISWLDQSTAADSLASYFQKIDFLANQLNQSLFLGLVDFEAHFSAYEPGSFYRKHVDQFKTARERRVSCVYYLNEDWDTSFAGELKLYDPQDCLITAVLPLQNRFICFNSDLPHEVCETKKTRYSIAGWMKVRTLNSPFMNEF